MSQRSAKMNRRIDKCESRLDEMNARLERCEVQSHADSDRQNNILHLKRELRNLENQYKTFNNRMNAILACLLSFLVTMVFLILLSRLFSVDYTACETNVTQSETEQAVETVCTVASVPHAAYYDAPLSYDLQDDLRAACEESGVDMALALAVIQKETNFRNVMGDGGNSYGYMQVQPRWHRDRMERLGVTDLMDPESNFRVGCDYLAELLEKHPVENALSAYNSGRPDITQYAESVLSIYEYIKQSEVK